MSGASRPLSEVCPRLSASDDPTHRPRPGVQPHGHGDGLVAEPGSAHGAADRGPRSATSSPHLHACRADHRFGGPEVLDVVDIAEPEPGPGQQLNDVSTAGVDYADAHHLGAPRGVRAMLSSAPL